MHTAFPSPYLQYWREAPQRSSVTVTILPLVAQQSPDVSAVALTPPALGPVTPVLTTGLRIDCGPFIVPLFALSTFICVTAMRRLIPSLAATAWVGTAMLPSTEA